jgi:hypothetical protein
MQNFNAIRQSFETYYVENGYGTKDDLDYYRLVDLEASMRPERAGFASYRIKMVNELFAFYMAGFKAAKP